MFGQDNRTMSSSISQVNQQYLGSLSASVGIPPVGCSVASGLDSESFRMSPDSAVASLYEWFSTSSTSSPTNAGRPRGGSAAGPSRELVRAAAQELVSRAATEHRFEMIVILLVWSSFSKWKFIATGTQTSG